MFGSFFGGPFVNNDIEYLYEQYLGDTVVNRQKISMAPEIMKAYYFEACKKAMRESGPTKLSLKKFDKIWNKFDNDFKTLELSIIFKNRSEEEWPD